MLIQTMKKKWDQAVGAAKGDQRDHCPPPPRDKGLPPFAPSRRQRAPFGREIVTSVMDGGQPGYPNSKLCTATASVILLCTSMGQVVQPLQDRRPNAYVAGKQSRAYSRRAPARSSAEQAARTTSKLGRTFFRFDTGPSRTRSRPASSGARPATTRSDRDDARQRRPGIDIHRSR